MCKAKAAAAALTGTPPVPTTGQRDANLHRVIHPSSCGRRVGQQRQIEMIVKHYHFHQQAIAGCYTTSNIIDGQDMSVPPPADRRDPDYYQISSRP